MKLCVDIGNSKIKCSLFTNNGVFVNKNVFNHKYFALILSLCKQYPEIESAIVSDVSGKWEEWNLKFDFPLLNFSHTTPLPIHNEYTTPETLGLDRLAGVIGANYLFPDVNCLVVDLGTCIKFDFVTKESIYKGGSISLGLHMRLKALHTFTGKLPLVNFKKEDVNLTGKNTKESILSGVVKGMKYELESRIEEYQSNFDDVQIIVTGGGSNDFVFKDNLKIFACPNLLGYGLYFILKYNDL